MSETIHIEPISCAACQRLGVALKPFGLSGAFICYDCWMSDDSPNYQFSVDAGGRFRRTDKGQAASPDPQEART